MKRACLGATYFGANEFPKHLTKNLTQPLKFALHHIQFQYHHYTSLQLDNDQTNESQVQKLHAHLIKTGSFQALQVGIHLLGLYVKVQNLVCVHKVFEEMPDRDVHAWTVLLSGFLRGGCGNRVLDLFREMQADGVCANKFTLSCVLKCCSSLCEVRLGKEVHGWILRNEVDLDIVLENSVLDLYVKCQAFEYAKGLFERMEDKDSVSWNIMIGAYLHIGDVERSVNLFERLPEKDVVSWNTIINGLMKKGFERTAVEVLSWMINSGLSFNKMTFSIALNLVSALCNVELGRQIHGRVLRLGVQEDGFIRNSLIDMYCKCGEMDKASFVFGKTYTESVRIRNSMTSGKAEVVSWSSMVSGYVHNGDYENAFKLFTSMVCEHVEVDKFTLTSIVSACANAGILELGRQIHAHSMKAGHKIDAHLSSSLIDMYAKCGSLPDVQMIFKQTENLNVVQWTSMISGYAFHGQGREAVQLFEKMIKEGITPNEVTFVGILTACSHSGLLEEGCKYFELMKEVYGIKPGLEHYTCMVDLYGRAGRLIESKEFIYKNNLAHLSAVWRSFLSSCRLHKNVAIGKWVSEKLLQLEPYNPSPYVLLSNTFASEHRWQESENLRRLMQRRRITKYPGQSWIQLKNQVHSFVMGDRSHPQDAEIYSYLEKLIGRLKEIGYLSDVEMVMQDVEEEQREMLVGFHSEKLAVAYGIISTTGATPIRVMKNLRICADCHNFIKYTSQLLGREIIVRDIHRFHHFTHGRCSCRDYW